MIPRATYRIQFHRDFPFAAAVPIAPYLAGLGISHVYASPIGTARAGSNHGYDQIDPTVINPELGGEDGFRALAAALKAEGLGIILDIVPNHVAVGHGDNLWWLDVLAHGEGSRYAQWFDIDWHPADPTLDGRLLAPFLGTSYGEALGSGDLAIERVDGRLALVAYGEHVFPLRDEDQGIDPATIDGPAALHDLCERQHWRLASWRSAGDAINWRRFFDVTELAGIRVESDDVFDAVHALPLRLYAEGLIDGLRVDHVDGLADPAAYCVKLRGALEDAAPGRAYLVVEKILGGGELLDPAWRTDGTSGYDFMSLSAELLHEPGAAGQLGALWAELSGRSSDFAPEELAARREILAQGFAGQLDATADAFHAVALSDLTTRDIAAPAWRRAIAALIECFPVYRTYGTGEAAPASDGRIRATVADKAKAIAAPADAATIDRVVAWLAGEGPGDVDLRADAVRRFQQLSAPIAAKAVEDTAFYRYGRLLSRNNVGFDPDQFATGPGGFCAKIAARAADHPHAMLATATHDHKRGEDVRARLSILSEIPDRWAMVARAWSADVPASVDRGDANMLHQMIVGAWPIGLAPDDAAGLGDFADRLAGWQEKALREAKLRSSWAMPDADYEAACDRYLRALLTAGLDYAVEAAAFVAEIAAPGAARGMVQAALRCTVPGVPDCFQGREVWDFSLVDPDNRTPVDYAACSAMLASGADDWRSGAAKQRLIADLLGLRRDRPALFADGGFAQVALAGPRARHAVAFTRTLDDEMLVFVAATATADVGEEDGRLVLPEGWWEGTTLDNGRPVTDIVGRAVLGWTISPASAP